MSTPALPPPPKNTHWAKGPHDGGGLHKWLGLIPPALNDLESRSGTSVAGNVATIAELPATAEDGQSWIVRTREHAVPHPALYTWSGLAQAWSEPVSIQGAATEAAIAAAIPSTQVRGALTGPVASEILAAGAGWEVAAGTALGHPTHATVQAACDAAAATGKLAYAAGSYTTDQTLNIRSDADLGRLSISYTGAGVAVRVGTRTGRIERITAVLPRVKHSSKSGSGGGWTGNIATAIGVEICNLYAASVTAPYISGFGHGLRVTANGLHGCVYNTVYLGHLENNKINHHLTVDSTQAWTNQNLFIGGRLSHVAAEGNQVPGTRHIKIDGIEEHPTNNNLWLNTSVEGEVAEYHAEIAGTYNLFLNVRWEAAAPARIYWGAPSARNQILYGYNSHIMDETFHPDAGTGNVIHSGDQLRMNVSAGNRGALLLENNSSASAPTDVIMAPGATKAKANPATAYTVARSAAATRMKRNADAQDRLVLDHVNGKVLFGNGVEPPTRAISYVSGNGSIRLDGFATWTSAVPADGTAPALPAQPAGYLRLNIDGTNRYVPYY